MTLPEFLTSIQEGYDLFEELGLVRTFSCAHSLAVNSDFNKVALDTSIAYPEVFMHALRLGHYNFQLKDFSFFQFSMKGLEELRICFYPSPFGPNELGEVKKLTNILDAGGIDFESYCYFLENLNFNARRPLIRYEYSQKQYEQGIHPAAHLHIGTYGEDRWVCEKRMSPYAFCLMTAKLYFSDHWEAVTEEQHDGTRVNNFDDRYFAAKKLCVGVHADYFSAVEKSQFHFT